MITKKRTLIALFITPLLAATLLLSGCSINFTLNDDTVNDAVDSATETADNLANAGEEAADAAEMLAGIEFEKATRIVVCDPKTGKTIKEITDQTAIEEALMPLSQENSIAVTPDAPEEYIFELWQPETIKLGQDESDVSEEKVIEITTYKNSDTIRVSMTVLGDISLSMTSANTAEALRNLAE